MEIHESDLPGVGRKFSTVTSRGAKLVIVVHYDGTRELFRFGDDPDRPEGVLELTDEEAHALGAVLSGARFEPVTEEAVLEVMQGIHLRWFAVQAGGFFAGRSIGELRVRTRTGASVIAIMRAEEHVPNPSPDEVLRVGDTVVALGSNEQMERLIALAGGEADGER